MTMSDIAPDIAWLRKMGNASERRRKQRQIEDRIAAHFALHGEVFYHIRNADQAPTPTKLDKLIESVHRKHADLLALALIDNPIRPINFLATHRGRRMPLRQMTPRVSLSRISKGLLRMTWRTRSGSWWETRRLDCAASSFLAKVDQADIGVLIWHHEEVNFHFVGTDDCPASAPMRQIAGLEERRVLVSS